MAHPIASNQRSVVLASTLLFLSLASLTLPIRAQDNGWDFRNVKNKAEALERAKSAGLRGLSFDDGPVQGGRVAAMFDDWAKAHNKGFRDPQARQKAMRNFLQNMKKVRDINLDPEATWWASGNQFSDLSSEEFVFTYLMKAGSFDLSAPTDDSAPASMPRKLQQIPSEVNWVTAGKVTNVRSQGACGNCWAFATTSILESMYLIRYGGNPATLAFSDQQLTSCIYADGCRGGSPVTALNYVYGNGITTAAIYPYQSGWTRVGGTCSWNLLSMLTSGQIVKTSGMARGVTSRSENAFMLATAANPIAFYFTVTASFQQYAGGIYYDPYCTTAVNHAMVIVGYSLTQRYWVVKNSWGTWWGESATGWGERGYVRIRMTGDGVGPCGMYMYGMQPSLSFTSMLWG